MTELSSQALAFVPLIPTALVAAAAFVLLILAIMRPASPMALAARVAFIAVMALALLNPTLRQKIFDAKPKTIVVLVDRSPSMSFAPRQSQADTAKNSLLEQLKTLPNLSVRTVEAPTDPMATETNLFAALDQAFSGVPQDQRGGAILLSDGQVHDVPTHLPPRDTYGPVHLLLAGNKNDSDWRLSLHKAPAYGLVGGKVEITLQLDRDGPGRDQALPVTLQQGSQRTTLAAIAPGIPYTVEIPIDQAGPNVLLLSVPVAPGEVSEVNNQLPITVQGVRDRLKVLLVAAEPNIGGRLWRNMLTSDPSIDLVHFTILRNPDSFDPTPTSEMSLIPFPFEELFERKLQDFDLVILDKYRANLIMPNRYLDNIAAYVRQGGGLLEVSGRDFIGENSVATTRLGEVLPTTATGEIFTTPFAPHLSDLGRVHPITRALHDDAMKSSWFLQIGAAATRGDALLLGAQDKPLLVVSRVDQGRVAQLTSDQIWLWARGYQGGGPYLDLLHPLLHWLLKEQNLEEESLQAAVTGSTLTIDRYTLADHANPVTVTRPDNTPQTVQLRAASPGHFTSSIDTSGPGLYSISDGTLTRTVAVGALDVPEWRDIVARDDKLKDLVKNSGGVVIPLADTPQPKIRAIARRMTMGGNGWIGVPAEMAQIVTGVEEKPLMPPLGWLIVLIACALSVWWIEGRSRSV